MEEVEVVVIGAGLVGAAIAYDLAGAGAQVLVLEAASEVAAGASRSNSGILHTGFDSTPDTFETHMILAQSARWRSVFADLEIPFRVPGALLLARDEEQAARLEDLAANAERNRVAVEIHDQASVQRLEPGAPAKAGLLVPGEAMTDPYEVVQRLLSAGPTVRLGWPVTHIMPEAEGAIVVGPMGQVRARFVINCAGLFADEVAGDGSFRITPRRGEFLVFPQGSADLVNHLLLPVPNSFTKGILVFPTLYGYLCAGPTAEDQEDKEDWRPRPEALERIRAYAVEVLPALKNVVPIDAWAGLRPVGHPHNYVVEWSAQTPALLHVAGIRSTGLSACLGLSQHVLGLLRDRGLETRPWIAPAAVAAETPRPWWQRLNALRGISE
jgi:glycerol-3-phosphate dehydrogenase